MLHFQYPIDPTTLWAFEGVDQILGEIQIKKKKAHHRKRVPVSDMKTKSQCSQSQSTAFNLFNLFSTVHSSFCKLQGN